VSDLVVLLLLVGFTARLARLIQADHLTARLRERIYDRWPYDAARGRMTAAWAPELREVVFAPRLMTEPVPPSPLGYWLHCPWCLGLWLAVIVVAVVAQLVSLPLPVLWAAAVAEGVGLLGRA